MKTNNYNFKTKLCVSVSAVILLSLGLQAQSPCPEINSISASPANVCAEGSSQLKINLEEAGYEVSNITYAAIATPGSGVTTLCEAGVVIDSANYHGSDEYDNLDDASWSDQSIPFDFNFFGTTYSSFGVGTNGSIFLGSGEQMTGEGETTTGGYDEAFPSPYAVAPCIAGIYSDLNFEGSGTINYFVTGTAPNRILVINYTNGQYYDGDVEEEPYASGSLTTQVLIYETTNVIEVHTENSTGGNGAVQGIQNADGTVAYTVEHRNNEGWVVESADAYRFTPPEESTYAWTPSALLDDSTLATPMASGIVGTTTFYVTVTTGSCIAYDSVTVYQEELSGFTDISLSSVCSGTDVQLFASGKGGGEPYTYSWTGPDHFSSTDRNPTINDATTAADGVYTVEITDLCSNTATYTVSLTVNPLPVVDITAPTTICLQATPVTLTATPSGGTFAGPGVDAATFNPMVAGVGVAEITYTVTDEHSCTGSLSQDITVEDCTGVNENTFSQDVHMYPNPTNGMFTIEIQNATLSYLTMSIIDAQGKEVYSVSEKNMSSTYKQQINIEHLSKGIYFIKLSSDAAVTVKKLTLQ